MVDLVINVIMYMHNKANIPIKVFLVLVYSIMSHINLCNNNVLIIRNSKTIAITPNVMNGPT